MLKFELIHMIKEISLLMIFMIMMIMLKEVWNGFRLRQTF